MKKTLSILAILAALMIPAIASATHLKVYDLRGRLVADLGNRVAALVVPLPVGEGSPLARVCEIANATRDRSRRSSAVSCALLLAVVVVASSTSARQGAARAGASGMRVSPGAPAGRPRAR